MVTAQMSSVTLGIFRVLHLRVLLALGAEGQFPLPLATLLGQRHLDRAWRLDRLLQAVDVHLLAEHLRELLDLRQLAEVLQAEVEEELLRGAVEHRTADHFLAPRDADEALLEE